MMYKAGDDITDYFNKMWSVIDKINKECESQQKKLCELQAITGMSKDDCIKRLQRSLFTIDFTIHYISKTGEWPNDKIHKRGIKKI